MFFRDKESFFGYYGWGLWVLFLLQTYGVTRNLCKYWNYYLPLDGNPGRELSIETSRLLHLCVLEYHKSMNWRRSKQNVHIFMRILADNDSLQHAAINGNLYLW